MALSDEEQRLLEQMEAALAADDPKLVNALRGTGVRRVHRRRAAIAGVGFFAGLALLVAGISINPFLSVLGFVIMVAAAVTAIYSWQHVGTSADFDNGGDRAKTAARLPERRQPGIHGQDGRALAPPARRRLLTLPAPHLRVRPALSSRVGFARSVLSRRLPRQISLR